MSAISLTDPPHLGAWELPISAKPGVVLILAVLLLVGCRPAGENLQETPAFSEDLSLAWDVLISVFANIHAGRYDAVTKGLAELPPDLIPTLSTWDPTWQAEPEDVPAVLEKACTGGFTCLPIRRVIAVERISETEYEFHVELSREDGSVFVLEPCCGAMETEMPAQSVFPYRVVRDSTGQWRVKWAPIYLP